MTYNYYQGYTWTKDIDIQGCYIKPELVTCTGVAAISSPATPPPITRPSGLERDMLSPPVLLRDPITVVGQHV